MNSRTLSRALPFAALAAAFLSAPAATGQEAGAVLYDGTRLTGQRLAVSQDVFDLAETGFGARRASSVDVAPGCRLTLFELSGYRGASVELSAATPDLGSTRLGRRAASSLRLECSRTTVPGWGEAVTLYRDVGRKGPSQAFLSDVPDLRGTSLGARHASSIEVPEGCSATLFSEPGYRGRSTTFRAAHDDLRRTDVGNDAAASLRVDCGSPAGSLPGDPGSAGAGGRGVTLYRDVRRTGPAQSFLFDVPDLAQTLLGAREASSIEVPAGCSATLFSEPGYRGRTTTFAATHDDLRRTGVGNDAAASLRVDCGSPGGTAPGGPGGAGRGVTLFRDVRRAGPSQSYLSDVPDLGQTLFGARQASSVEVSEGCVATLYSEPGYRGRSTTLREGHDDLRRTDVGNDTAASLRVECAARPRRLRPAGATPAGADGFLEGVTLFRDEKFRGESASFRSDVPDLSRTPVGGRAASSLRVPPGCQAVLYSETGYRGRSATFDGEHADLRGTPIGNDAAQSMRVTCGTRAW